MRNFSGLVLLSGVLAWMPAFAAQTVVSLEPGPDFEYRLETALVQARPDTVIELPAGRFELGDSLDLRASHITIRGQGMDKTILSFKNQFNGGEGLLVTGDAFTAEDFAIEDTPGDGLKMAGVNGITVRRVRVEWTRGPDARNGSYGLYPVSASNILIEDCVVRGASDAGIYVGQSRNIVVRHNNAHENVAGIEIENSHHADVYENLSTHNTGGVLVFDLPNLPIQGGGQIRVFRNRIIENNTRNFAPKGNIVGIVPAGTGFMAMANRDVEVFDNVIVGQNLASVAVTSYLVSQLPINDPRYNPIPRRVFIHDNVVEKAHGWHLDLGNPISTLINVLFFIQARRVSDVLYDGIGENYDGAHGLPDEERICVSGNTTVAGKPSRASNLQLANKRWWLPFPGGPVLGDAKLFACSHPAVPEAELEEPPAAGPQAPEPTPDMVEALCDAQGVGPNWAALAMVDCPRLDQYRLFAQPSDPRRDPQAGVGYELTTPLFSDYSTKHRFVFVPPLLKANYSEGGVFDFPVGTVISKTFGFGTPERVVETRLLVRRLDGWVGLPYIWSADGQSAALSLGGGVTDLSFTTASTPQNPAGKLVQTRYPIPSANQCSICHAGADGALAPIGPKARLLNRDYDYADGHANQIAQWAKLGILDGAPADPAVSAPRLPVWNDVNDGTRESRARAYLEVNCAHCHGPSGFARNTGLFLDASVHDSTLLGVCKPPVAAGLGAGRLQYDVVPGKPGKSILVYRLTSSHAKVKMPQLGRTVVHDEGVDLVSSWVKDLQGKCVAPKSP